MAILDSQGRLFGKVSILDAGAALVILMVIIGIFFFPGTSGSVAQLGSSTKPVEVDVIVRGLGVRDPRTLIQEGSKTSLVIRNQPYGEVTVQGVRILPKNIAVPQPDGSVKALPDPRPEASLTADMIVTLAGNAQITKDGPVLGNNKIKVGTLVELEGLTYDISTIVMDVRIKG